MNVKQGDTVKVNGIQAIVETLWGQGKHTLFKLSDGREVLDLDASYVVEVSVPVVETPRITSHTGPFPTGPHKKWSP